MSPDNGGDRDAASLWDMLQAAAAVVEFTRDVSLERFRRSRLIRHAVERELEIIGEAARRVGEACRSQHAEIPWRRMVSLRNFIAHVYDAIDDERIWRLAREDVPPLIEQLRRIVPAPPDPAPGAPAAE